MNFAHSEVCLAHDPGRRHPESPDRLRAVRRRLARAHAATITDAADADRDLVETVHDPDYVAELERFCADGGGDWDPDTTATPETWDAALRSAGLAVHAAERALAGDTGRATPFALGRPPGHHAVPDDAMGFCFLNNVAVATAAARRHEAVDRVAVFDWDVHHGNGTQAVFERDPAVLYASVHEGGIYPGTGETEETGTGPGEGTTLNVPLPAGAGDAEYDHVLEAAVRPALMRFDPDLLLVSAGFDPHRHDPISRTRLSTEGFARLAAGVRAAAEATDAALAFVLEGGYGLETLADGVETVNEVFDGYEPAAVEAEPDTAVQERVERVRAVHDLTG